ncbi:MAG: M24 family metallopeptidase [Synechococcales cyanobacterium]
MGVSTASTAIADRLQGLRAWMQTEGIDVYVIPSADEHLNEYVPEAKQRRPWMSGFTGSAGDLIVTMETAWVFVDGRYYEQADQEVDPAWVQVSKVGLSGQKTLLQQVQQIAQDRPAGSRLRVGFDPFTVDVATYRDWQDHWKQADLVPIVGNGVDALRPDLPACDTAPIFAVPEPLTGGSLLAKITQVRDNMRAVGTGILPVTKLDQIAWLLNLRGADIAYNPVFMAYAIVTLDQVYLCTNAQRIPAEVQASLQPHVTLVPYAAYGETLAHLFNTSTTAALLAPRHTTVGTWHLADTRRWVESSHPIEDLKARKNATELAGMRSANLKASRAKTRVLHWIEQQMATGYTLTEASVAAQLESFYAQEEGFLGLSFNTIAGAGGNSSIVHYGTPDPQRTLRHGELLLLDSGCQFWGGTTDDTRTIRVGAMVTDSLAEQRRRYTRVLQAHINCARQEFPEGTTGQQLDAITRAQLWQAGLDYNHGTGHGVGAFLNVHEGPNGIHKRATLALEAGMINSIEPGYYEPGWGGIRLENLYTVEALPKQSRPANLPQNWFGFATLTYIPFEPALIDLDLLSREQQQWLRDYHAQVLAQLSPLLEPEVLSWLTTKVSP